MSDRPEWLALDPGEELVWTGGPRLRRILSTVARAVVVSLLAVAGAWAAVSYGPSLLGRPLPVPALAAYAVAGLVVLSQVASVVLAYLRTTNTDYALTSTGLYRKTGIVSERTRQVDLDRIQNTQLRKGVPGNLFDYGTVLVSTAGSGGADLAMTDLDDPETLRSLIRTRLDRVDDTTVTPRADPETVAEAIAETRALRETAERLADQLEP